MAVNRQCTELGLTRGGKRILAVPVGMRALFEIKLEGGGALPKILQGTFSDRTAALHRVKEYLRQDAEKQPKTRRTKKD
jgi:hypothetical protein